MKTILIVLGVILAAATSMAGSSKDSVHLYVFTKQPEAVQGFADIPTDNINSQKNRDNSVKIIKRFTNHKGTIELVDNPRDADLTVEVVSQSSTPSGSYRTEDSYLKGPQTVPNLLYVLQYTLRAGDYSTTIDVSSSASPFGGGPLWGANCSSIAEDIQKFVKANHDKLIAARKSK